MNHRSNAMVLNLEQAMESREKSVSSYHSSAFFSFLTHWV